MNEDLEFFDTETIKNKTVLICSSKSYLWNSGGLSYKDCFDFLITNSKKYNYFFRIDYDVNMIIKDLTKKNIIELFENNETDFENYKIKYFRNKIFSINNKKFYDIFNFFNTSLLNVIKILDIDLTEKEKEFVKIMKNKRADFSNKDKEIIIKYSLLENEIGLKIVEKIYNLIPEKLKTYALYGSSALSNKFMRKKINRSFIFSGELFEKSYFGGRMECFKIGTFENVYKYDINSAYPSVIKDLKKPLSYKIEKYNNQEIKEHNLYEINFVHTDIKQIGVFPIRTNSGYLVFPKEGRGYYYGCEVKEGIKRKIKIDILNFCDVKLGKKIFKENEIEKMYKLRLLYKKTGDKRNLIYKIILNAIYGKFAQRVGRSDFQNFYLAGYITAKIRAELLKAVFKKEKDIIFFSTDGILSKSSLNVKIGHKLGEWDFEKVNKAVVIQSGVYKLETEGGVKMGERGFRFDFDSAIKDIREKGIHKTEMQAFISNIYAFKNYKAMGDKRCKFTTIKKELSIYKQHKRIFTSFDIDAENVSFLLNKNHLQKLNELKSILDFGSKSADFLII